MTTPASLPVAQVQGRRVAFRSAHNTYVTAEAGGTASLIASRSRIGPEQTFVIHDLGNDTVALQASVNNKFVCAENGSGPLIANRSAVQGEWEKFRVIQPSPTRFDHFCLQSLANGRLVRAPDGAGAPLEASGDAIVDDSLFSIAWTDRFLGNGRHPGVRIALHSAAHNGYVTAENAGVAPLSAARASIEGAWQKFVIEDLGDGMVALKSEANNRFVCAEAGGAQPLIANRDSIGGDWERFRLVHLQDSVFAIQSMANSKFVRAPDAAGSELLSERTYARSECRRARIAASLRHAREWKTMVLFWLS